MTDRIHALTVILTEPVRDDDIQPIVDAILMIRGVAGVETHIINPDVYFALETARQELARKILDVLKK